MAMKHVADILLKTFQAQLTSQQVLTIFFYC